jgi:hypothetical protein
MTRVYSREEPGAGKLHARICEGESRMAELLDHDQFKSWSTGHVLLPTSSFDLRNPGREMRRSSRTRRGSCILG